MGDAIAHIMLSFGFADRDFVTVSIETRKEVGESYDTIRGFFRQYELIYIVGDERDLIRLRTNYRKNPPEDVYRLPHRRADARTRGGSSSTTSARSTSFATTRSFYNSLTTNCTTNVLRHTKVNPGDHAYSWKILLSGYAPLYAYERGRLDTSLPFEELKRRSYVNGPALAADQAPNFSQRIREGLPRPPAQPPL